MRVAIITTAGVTRQFRQWPEAMLGRALVARGHRVAAFTLLEDGSEITGAGREDVDGIEVRRVRVNKAWVAPALLPALLRFRPQVVHLFHLRNALNWQAALIAKALRARIVFTVVGPYHDPYLVEDREMPYGGRVYPRRLIYTLPQLARRLAKTRLHRGGSVGGQKAEGTRHKAQGTWHKAPFSLLPSPLGVWQNWCVHFPLKLADRLIALSRHEVGVLRRMGLDPGKVVRIPLWIDVPYIEAVPYEASQASSYQSPHVLFLGQLKKRKGYDTLAEAMPLVLKEFPGATFLFAGQNPANAGHLREICARNGTLEHAVLLGKVSEWEKVRLMRSADCLVYPTRYESFGLPPLEAMAAGCPVVATDLPVVSEMIEHGENGILVEREDPASLARGIIALLANPALRSALVAGGKRTLRRYAEGPIVERIAKLYYEC